MPIRLVPIDDIGTLPTIIVDRPIILIGRHSECDVQIRSSKVSRKHCCLAEVTCVDSESFALSVRDLDSTNGTRINGEIVAEGCLKEGDELTVGAFRFLVTNQASLPKEALLSQNYPIPLLEPPHDHILDARPKEISDLHEERNPQE